VWGCGGVRIGSRWHLLGSRQQVHGLRSTHITDKGQGVRLDAGGVGGWGGSPSRG
jgi:hypothetical protein